MEEVGGGWREREREERMEGGIGEGGEPEM